MPDIPVIAAIIFALISLIFFFAFTSALRKKKIISTAGNLLVALLFLTLALLSATISISLTGYSALTKEELAASVRIEPVSSQKFIAHFTFSDSSTKSFKIEGDELYVDAHIVKWKSLANIMGVHTLYELDRVAGRYTDIEDEKIKNRTVYSLKEEKLVDAFTLRKKYEFLSFLVDAKYGSATFANVRYQHKFKIFVSTSGLLIRKD